MRTIISFALILILCFTAVPVFAMESSGSMLLDQTEMKLALDVYEPNEDGNLMFNQQITDKPKTNEKGEVGSEKPKVNTESKLNDVQKNKPLPAKPHVKIIGSQKNGKVVINAKISNAEQVTGTWHLQIIKEGKKYFERTLKDRSEMTCTVQQALPAGNYQAVVTFTGQADEKYVSSADRIGVIVKRIADQPPIIQYTTQINNPTSGKKVVAQSNPGGLFPETATAYTVQIVTGILLVGAGLGVWIMRKKGQHQ